MWGECWEIKDKIGEKKFLGARNFGGELLGEMSKKKFRGEILGGSTNFRGRAMR